MDLKVDFDSDKPNFPDMILYEKNGTWTDEKLLTKVLNKAVLSEERLIQPDVEQHSKREIILNNN